MIEPAAWSQIHSRYPLRVKRKYISASPRDKAAYLAWLSSLTGNALIPSFCSNRKQIVLVERIPLGYGHTVIQRKQDVTLAMVPWMGIGLWYDSKNFASSRFSLLLTRTCQNNFTFFNTFKQLQIYHMV